ncbi:MAG TPA: pseudouridine synthase [Treponemataceae bacterium]|nr:pseudouridine synthase [Treponemataceae bacterium]
MSSASVRLDKLLSSNGFGSRRDIKRMLRSRRLSVNGTICFDAGTQIQLEKDIIELDGSLISLKTFVYLMLNKPAGVITSTEDPSHKTVIDLLPLPWSAMSLFPVGRLDLDTEGLLLLTNDGPLTHRLTSPKTGVDKTYYARLREPVNEEMFARYSQIFSSGVLFKDGYTCMPAILGRAGEEKNAFYLTIQEGKYHQVKKMFRVVDNEVIYLKRISMGSMKLDSSLSPGEWRELTSLELDYLFESAGC